jgi:hypothetical protein
MLILQTDDLPRDRARVDKLGVRIVWEANHPDVSAMHLHPKDIGAAIVSIDQPIPPESWRWAGPDWQRHIIKSGAQRVTSTTIASQDPTAMAQRYATVLGTSEPIAAAHGQRIDIQQGVLNFVAAKSAVISRFGIKMPNVQAALNTARQQGLAVSGNAVTICGTQFELTE